MEPIRVAQVMGYMNGGGVESVVMNYYRHIDREKVQFDFIVCEGSSLIPREEIESLGGRIFMVPDYKKMPQYLRALSSLFSRESWKIVHSHMNSLSVFPLSVAKKEGVPIRIAHNHATAGRGEYAKNAAKGILKLFANVYPTHRLACSRHAGEWLFGKDDFKIIPNAFDISEFAYSQSKRCLIRGELGLEQEALVFGHAGRFAAPKNQEWLIHVFAKAFGGPTGPVLVFAGDGPDRQSCEHQARRLGLGDRVVFLGQCDDMSGFYSAVDCFVFPSFYEGLGLALIEAQASGLPCIASSEVPLESDVGGRVEFAGLEDDVWVRLLRSVTPLPPSERTLVSKKISEDYSIEVSAPKLVSLYESVVRDI